jgi:uracil-DNA glycosylase family 4
MTPSDIIRELEYLQDLGFDTLYLPEGLGTLASIVQGAKAPGAAAPAQEVPRAAAPKPPVAPSAPAAAPARKPPMPPVQKPVTPPPVAASRPAAFQPLSPVAGKPLPELRSVQLPSIAASAASSNTYGKIELSPEGDTLACIQEDIGDCRRCRLCQQRTRIVFGSGNESAKLVFVGEGPGEEEDLSGLPFVGKAGQLLTRMIEGTAEREGLPIKRKDVYICNVVKCRPPSNRKPELDEMEICGQFLYRQLAVLKPKAICVLGATAAQALLNTRERMGDLRGNWQKWRDIPVMVTYHPSFLLRSYTPDAKRLAWEDLKKVLHFVYDDPANLPGA